MLGVKLAGQVEGEAVNFDVKARLEEKERRSQIVTVNFALFLTTKPSLVKFEVEGSAVLRGKDADINKMLEVDPETKVPYIFHRIYQQAFTAMYILSTLLKTPPPPSDLLFSGRQGASLEGVTVESGKVEEETKAEEGAEPKMQVATPENVEVGAEVEG